MQTHPIPQNITAFEFKLVGFLTIRQFGYLATVGVLSFIFFIATTSFLKWLIITPLVLIGLAFAFLPINGMPFEKWLFAFLSAITSPSLRVWQKKPKIISFLAPEFSYYLRRSVQAKPSPFPNKVRLETFLTQVKSEHPSKLDSLEQAKLSTLDFGESDKLSVYSAGKTAEDKIYG